MFRDFLSRGKEALAPEAEAQHSKHEVSCDTTKLKELITKWTQNDG